MIDPRVEKILITENEIHQAIDKAAKWINDNYKDKHPIMIAILKGAIPFYGALIPKITIDVQLDFMVVSSFKGEVYAVTEPEIITDLISDVKDRDLLLVEDVVDTARTMKQVVTALKNRGAKSIKIMTLVDKPSARKVDLKVDYSCFKIAPEFIVGFGLDYKEYMRNLPYIGVLKNEVYNSKEDEDE